MSKWPVVEKVNLEPTEWKLVPRVGWVKVQKKPTRPIGAEVD